METLSELFAILSEPIRLRLLTILLKGECCVCELQEPLKLPQSTVSRHLAILKGAGLVSSRRVGVWMHYQLSDKQWRAEWRIILPKILLKAAENMPKADRIACCEGLVKFKPENYLNRMIRERNARVRAKNSTGTAK